MNRNYKTKSLRLFALLLVFVMVIGVVPASAATKKVTYLEGSSIYNATVTIKDSKGNKIKPGDTVAVGTEITIKVSPDKYYEVDKNYGLEISKYVDGSYYTWEYIELDDDLTAKYTVDGYDFRFYLSASPWYNVTIKGDKRVKSIVVCSTDGKVEKSFSGKTASVKISQAEGFRYGEFRVRYVLEDGYMISGSEIDYGWVNSVYSDGSLYYEAYLQSNYDYEKDEYKIDSNKVKITFTSKKGSEADYAALDKLTTATATANKKKGVVNLKAKKTIVDFEYSVYDSEEYGHEEYVYTYDAKFNKSAAKNVERIDLSKLTTLTSDTVSSIVSYIIREYKKGNIPNLKAICLPKGCAVYIGSLDGYREYYPVVIYCKK